VLDEELDSTLRFPGSALSRSPLAALGHQDKNKMRRIYNRSRYWPERVKLMSDSADLIDELRHRI
jgi:hypothetical protein